jgi:hypothetical protein
MTFCACNNYDRQNKNVETFSNDIFMRETNDSTRSTKQILDKFLPSVLTFAKADTSLYYYGDSVIWGDSIFRLLIVGKFIDKKTIIATEINIKDTIINFYYLDNETWKLIGNEKTNIPIFRIDFEDLNGDYKNEVIVSTCRNWNGNTWQEVYFHSDKNKTIKYAGSFSTDYVIKKEKKQIEETFEASWYIDKSKTLYEWRQEKLVPIRQIILAHDQPVSENGALTFEYYENSTEDLEGLKLKFKEPYNDDNKKLQQLWDNFFSRQ